MSLWLFSSFFVFVSFYDINLPMKSFIDYINLDYVSSVWFTTNLIIGYLVYGKQQDNFNQLFYQKTM